MPLRYVNTLAELLALTAAIRALSIPLAEGAVSPRDLAALGLHVKTLADLAHEAAESLSDEIESSAPAEASPRQLLAHPH